MAEKRKDQIVKKATILFSKSGYDKVSIKELAAACMISEAALYRHFDSKQSIYDAVLDSAQHRISSEELFARLRQESDLEVILGETASFLIDILRKNDDLYRLLLYSALRGDLRAKEMYISVRGRFIEFVKSQIERFAELGLLYEIEPFITARCFIGSVLDCALGLNLWRGIDQHTISPAEAVANNIPIYARGLIKSKKSK